MFGYNFIDLLLVLLIALAVYRGIKIGIISQLFFIFGFFTTFFVSSWILYRILPINNPTTKTIVSIILVVILSVIVGIRIYDQGQKIHWSFRLGRLKGNRFSETIENILGALPSALAMLIFIWLIGTAISRMPFAGLSNSVSDSKIFLFIDSRLPTVPIFFADFNNEINPNKSPTVNLNPKPSISFDYSSTAFNSATKIGSGSVVRITSFNCGGIVTGSGFAVSSDLIATAAHVIAGSSRPIVKFNGLSYVARPIYFNTDLDLAILKVDNLSMPYLSLAKYNTQIGTTVAVIGYPGGNYDSSPGIINDTLAVNAASIYDQGSLGRGIYVIQTSLSDGNSGSPILDANGKVLGIIFSKSIKQTNVAYGLTSVNMLSALQQAKVKQNTVSTGICTSN